MSNGQPLWRAISLPAPGEYDSLPLALHAAETAYFWDIRRHTVAQQAVADIGLIGLAVMGQNLALNIADHGYAISVYNRTTSKMEEFVGKHPSTPGKLTGWAELKDFVASLKRPRKIIILVQAGRATDAVINELVPLLEKDDIIIDGGNAYWMDTIRREKELDAKGLRFIGSGVSGGE